MSRTARARLFFRDGYYEFRLRIGELEELSDLTGLGPDRLRQQIGGGEWRPKMLKDTLRLALIGGGGLSPEDAFKVVERNVIEGYLAESVLTALAVLGAAIFGVEDDPVGEPQGEPAEPPTDSPTPGSAGADSTGSAP